MAVSVVPAQKIARGVDIEFVSPALDAAPITVAVTVPTFKRPEHLARTLESLARQDCAERFAVIVMENHAQGREGVPVARGYLEAGMLDGLVVTVEDPGNCNAYNGGWLTALRVFENLRFIAVIDDDECADPAWLARLLDAAETFDAQCVGGPQIPVFDDDAPEVHRAHPVFAPPYASSGVVDTLYSSGNVLLRADHLKAMGMPFLDPAFNFTGGGDADFFMRSARKGARLAWCNEAIVHETVPARRLQPDWLRARSRRNGALSTLIERRKRDASVLGPLQVLMHSLALLAAAPVRAVLELLAGPQVNARDRAMNRIDVAIGRMEAHFGKLDEQYRKPDQN